MRSDWISPNPLHITDTLQSSIISTKLETKESALDRVSVYKNDT